MEKRFQKGDEMKKLLFDTADSFLILIIINVLLYYFFPIKQIIFSPFIYMGIVLFVLGWMPNIWIWAHFRKISNPIPTKDIPKKLVTSGLFRFSRNPTYLGMIVALFGEAIFLGDLVTFIIPVIFTILINKTNIPFEEDNLEKKFGKKYLDYKLKVRRWI